MTARIAVLDIERQSAIVDGVWELKQNGYISPTQIVEPARTICFAWKWLGEDQVNFAAEWHEEDWVKHAWDVMDEADYIVGWNSKSFDMKHLRTEIISAGMGPPSPHKDIDLMLVARRNFGFMSNRLAYVAEQLGAGSKLATGGADLWRTLRNGTGKTLAAAQQKMEDYNCQDVLLTEEMYYLLLPWVTGLNIPLYAGTSENACANCGSVNIHYRGKAVAATRSYRRFQCQDCGKWGKENKFIDAVTSSPI